ncbi:MAG: energy-coupling factor transporter ATPase [Oscillospiraceae bacterium]|nr:energy-coupling factor transporter ATPase [Oscillospiraceae bacterium]
MAILKTEGLTYIYGTGTPFEKKALDNVNVEIQSGEIAGIIGHTGSGKSTLVQHFNGLLRPSSGKVYFNGEDIWKDKKVPHDLRFEIGLVFQYPEYQIFEETVFKDIAYGPKNMKLDEKSVDERVRQTAQMLQIPDSMLSRSPFELSGGQKRRVAIAGVMAMRPKVLILDEPTAGLDPRGRDTILGLIKNYNRETGCTVLIVSHSMEDMARFADKLLVMNKSRLFCYDEVSAVFSKADEISDMGLSVPQITRVFNSLKKSGYDLGEEIYTVKYAAKKVLEYLNKEGDLS